MNFFTIFVQGLGILALIFYVISYQFKKPALFYLFSFAGATAFCVHYALLGSIGGCICNVVSMLKALYLWLFPNVKRKAHYYSFIGAYVIVCALIFIFKWDSYLVLLTCAASIAHCYMFFQDNEKVLRVIQIAVVSPLWIIYNIFDNLTITGEFVVSIGGILTETFVVASSIVYLIRHKNDSKQEPVQE
mgnify:CR=1 FL=1